MKPTATCPKTEKAAFGWPETAKPSPAGAGTTGDPRSVGAIPLKYDCGLPQAANNRGWRSRTSNLGGLEFCADFEVAAVRVAVPAVVEAKTSDPWVHQHDPQSEAVLPSVLIQRLV